MSTKNRKRRKSRWSEQVRSLAILTLGATHGLLKDTSTILRLLDQLLALSGKLQQQLAALQTSASKSRAGEPLPKPSSISSQLQAHRRARASSPRSG